MNTRGAARRGGKMMIRSLMACACAAMIVLVLLSFPVYVRAQSARGVSWDYKLLGPLNQAQDPNSELTMVIKGSGSFTCSDTSCSSGAISGGGSYVIINTIGNVVGRGTWSASVLDSFLSWGPGDSPGEGGHLELEASFSGFVSGSKDVVIHCSMWSEPMSPPGYPWPSDYVTAGSFTQPVTGAVMFNLNQG